MFYRYLCIIILLFATFSCGGPADENAAAFSITSPKVNWIYYNDMPVLFAVNAKSDVVQWNSSIDGDLGTGNDLQKWISTGTHNITAVINGTKKTVVIVVNDRALNTYDEVKILLNNSSLTRQFSQGEYYSCITSLDGSVEKFSISPDAGNARTGINIKSVQTQSIGNNAPLRDFRPAQYFKYGFNTSEAVKTKKALTRSYNIGDIRSFLVINTASQGDEPHNVAAELYYTSQNLNLWKPAGAVIDGVLLQNCIDKIESLILPRVHAIWGLQADIDDDGKIAVLLSQTINNEGLALGYFNPSDFFKYNNDPMSENYNPASNEMDILYVAVPENTSGSSYSGDTIVATIGHELTHAVNFTKKTWVRIQEGETDFPQEEVFLDEGWSHLSENLLGFGASGGNILFFNLFLNDTASYSFCRANRLGQYDSAGMRGAMTLFMSWLFWKKGGMTWNSDNPALVEDAGGISFLRKLVSSSSTGWESIGIAYGKPTGILFQEMIYEMNCSRINPTQYNYRKDKLTGEPAEFFLNMGTIVLNEKTINIGLPMIYEAAAENPLSTLPWSVLFLEPLVCSDNSIISFNSLKYYGNVFLCSVVNK